MSTSGLCIRLALAVIAMVVAITGCSPHPLAPPSPTPPRTRLSPAQTTDSAAGSAQSSDAKASDNAAAPDQDGHPACAAYDSWRPGPNGAGITVTHWYEGTDPVKVTVRQPGIPDLSQTVDNDVTQRYHDFEFLDVDPKAVAEVLITTGTVGCYVRAVPAP
jgi:hypothetical protein